MAQPVPDAALKRLQSQQQEETINRAVNTPNVFTKPDEKQHDVLTLSEETPCFVINKITWRGVEEFSWLTTSGDGVLNRCVGGKGLRALQDYLTNQMIIKGYVTTRILIPEQSLASGLLMVQVVPGRISKIKDEGAVNSRFHNAFPTGEGGLLNQRDLDQALENIRRLPSQQAVTFKLVPGANPGESDVVVEHPPAKRWRALINLDDSGSDSTGKRQLGATLTIDSPLNLYDYLAINLGRNANIGNTTLGTNASSITWTVPLGYWNISSSINRSAYKQTVAGFSSNIEYTGKSQGVSLGLNHVFSRSAHSKRSIDIKLARKVSRSYIADVEVDVQGRDIVEYSATLADQEYFGSSVFDASISMRASLPQLSKGPGFIIGQPQWDGRYQVSTLSASLMVPFKLAGQNVRYQGAWTLQRASALLPPNEYFSIGNRYTVRGFDGTATLAAENGWMWRNDLIWSLGQSGHELFVGLDTGRVSGPNSVNLVGNALTGMVIGMRGRMKYFKYDVTAGRPIRKPDNLQAPRTAITASIGTEF